MNTSVELRIVVDGVDDSLTRGMKRGQKQYGREKI